MIIIIKHYTIYYHIHIIHIIYTKFNLLIKLMVFLLITITPFVINLEVINNFKRIPFIYIIQHFFVFTN